MKRLLICAAIAAASLAPDAVQAQTSGFSLGKVLEGVFSKSDLEVKDLAGEWTVEGSAVALKSDNLLEKAGGAAIAATVESKIDPYFNQLGLKGAVLTVQADGSFELKSNRVDISGILTRNSDGTFAAKLNKGKLPLGTLTTYIEKTSQSMDVMFDATKLQKLLSTLSSITNNSTLNLANSVLSAYDGILIGLGTKKTGKVSDMPGTPSNDSTETDSGKTTGSGSLIEILKDRLKR